MQPYGLLHVLGRDFGSTPSFTVAGAAVSLLFSGETFAVMPLPMEAVDGQPFQVQVNNGLGVFAQQAPAACPNPPNVDGTGTAAERRAAFCKIAEEVNRRLGIPPRNGPAFHGGKWLLLMIAAHEGAGMTARRQAGGGPAYSIFQIEPDTLKDIWNNGGLSTAQKDAIAGAAGITRDELDRKIQAITGNAWPEGSCLCDLLNNDLFAAMIARSHFRRWPTPMPGEGPPVAEPARTTYICAMAELWLCRWRSKPETQAERDRLIAQFKRWARLLLPPLGS